MAKPNTKPSRLEMCRAGLHEMSGYNVRERTDKVTGWLQRACRACETKRRRERTVRETAERRRKRGAVHVPTAEAPFQNAELNKEFALFLERQRAGKVTVRNVYTPGARKRAA